ncbi:MAG: alpha/beta hydrolase [Pseudomonadota bacterium]
MTPLVLVHGFMGASAQWAPQREALGARFDLIAVDLPGFGENANLRAIDRIGDFADWILQHLSQMGVGNFHLLGHSMGGMIVQEMVSRAPERIKKLVLYGTGPSGNLPGRFETIEESKRRAATDGPRQTARRISATWFLNNADDPSYETCAALAEKSSAGAIAAGLDAMSHFDATDRLGAIAAPTLILWGDHDRTYSWAQTEQLWNGIAGANLAVVPGCAHAVHLEKPALFNDLVLDFL